MIQIIDIYISKSLLEVGVYMYADYDSIYPNGLEYLLSIAEIISSEDRCSVEMFERNGTEGFSMSYWSIINFGEKLYDGINKTVHSFEKIK